MKLMKRTQKQDTTLDKTQQNSTGGQNSYGKTGQDKMMRHTWYNRYTMTKQNNTDETGHSSAIKDNTICYRTQWWSCGLGLEIQNVGINI